MSTRFYVNPASLLFVVFIIGGAFFVYHKVEDAKLERLREEARLRKEMEQQAAAERARQAEAQRLEREEAELRRAADLERERMRQETERLRIQAEQDRRAKLDEERRKATEAAQRERDEAARKRREAEEAARLRAGEDAARRRIATVDEARAVVKEANLQTPRLEAVLAEKRRQVSAAKVRIEGAEKTQALALNEAREWARKHGVKLDGREFTWDWLGRGSTTEVGSVMVQDNREQIEKCRAKYDAAVREGDQAREAMNAAEKEAAQAERQLAQLQAAKTDALEVLKRNGVDVAEAAPPAAPAAGTLPVYVLKDGRRIEAKRAMTIDDSYALQLPNGKTETIKKDDVVEIVQP